MDRTEAPNQKGRVTVYDWVRIIATILVVIGHSAYLSIHTTFGGIEYLLPANLHNAYNSPPLSMCRYLSRWVYGFHMPLFFMLSGAVFALKPMQSLDRIFKAKFRRLLVPYFVWGWLFMLPIKRLGNFYTNDTLRKALQGFLSGQDSGHLWFLTALFWCIILFCVIAKTLRKLLKIQSIYALLLVVGVIQLSISYLPFDVLGFKKGIGYIFYFAVGYVFEIERSSKQKWNIKKTISTLFLLILLEILNKKFYLLNSFFIIMAGSFLTYILSDLLDRIFKNITENRAWKFLVKNIFYVYIFHDPLEYIVLRVFIGKNLLASSYGCYLYTFCRIVVIFAVSLLLGDVVEKIKGILNRMLSDKPADVTI